MIRCSILTAAVALALSAAAPALGAGTAHAQNSDLPPERAPAAQQHAPPARIAPPMNAGQHGGATDANANDVRPNDVRPNHIGPNHIGPATTTGQGASGARERSPR